MRLWNTVAFAQSLGMTHRASMFGILPGYTNPDDPDCPWMLATDLLAPVEDLLALMWVTMREMRGEEPDFMFQIREPLPATTP